MSRGRGSAIGKRKAVEIRRRKARAAERDPQPVPTGIRNVGVVWYRSPEDYDRIRAMSVDAKKLQDTFEDWLQEATRVAEVLKSKGLNICRVHLDPETFPAWCLANGSRIDAQARSMYAQEAVSRLINQQTTPRPA